MRGQAATGSGEAESGHDRRIGDQIVRAVLTGGITPFERGDGRGVLHTKTTARLKRERGLSGRALHVKLMDVSPSALYEKVPSNASSSLRNLASAFSAFTTGRCRFSRSQPWNSNGD